MMFYIMKHSQSNSHPLKMKSVLIARGSIVLQIILLVHLNYASGKWCYLDYDYDIMACG